MERRAARRYASVVLDVDSTLCAIEGIDWLATRRGPGVAAQVRGITDRAMAGEIALDDVYGERLALVRPSADDVAALAAAYEEALLPDAAGTIARFHGAGLRVVLVSGGLREAILPVARRVGVAPADLHAVAVRHDASGAFAGYDAASPLTRQDGKRDVVAGLHLPRPTLAVGDGATDLAMRGAVDTMAAFTAIVRREPVVRAADMEITSYSQLAELVLG